jgi:DNA-binding transcriptional MocR family regulator
MKKYLLVFIADEVPKYIQIFRHIKKLIDNGDIIDGEKLPSIRMLSKNLKVNNITVINAYKRLHNEGYAVLKSGSGTFAKKRDTYKNFKKEYSDTFKKLSSGDLKNIIDFAGETTSSTFFPVDTFKTVLNEVLDRDGADALVYQDVLGYKGLRESISKFFWLEEIKPEDILIVSGAQQGIDIISKALINVNDNIIVEKPTYNGALSVFTWRRANIYELDMLDDGVDISNFETIIKRFNIKFFYCMSYFQNPTGSTYSLEKKLKILELAKKYDFFIIEDDYLSELIYDSNIEYRSFKSLDKDNRVFYIKSFSKIFLPGIRLGYLVSPPQFKELVQSTKINSDISTSSLMQRALDLYINKNYWKEHIKYINGKYEGIYNYLEKELSNQLKGKVKFLSPGGGLSFFLEIENLSKINSMELFYACRDKGVIITPGVMFFKALEDGLNTFRISFSQVTEEQIEKGISILKELL